MNIDLLKNGLANILNAQEIEESVEKIHQLENKLDEIYNYETAGSIVRACVKWAEEGERSTKYLCGLEKRRSERKNIHRLKASDGTLILESVSIMNELHSFYSKLYSLGWTQNSAAETDQFFF